VLFVERARLQPGTRLVRHGHGEAHLCLVLAGGFRERVARRREDCDEGSLRISRPGTEHDLTAGGEGTACLVASFPGELLAEARVAASPSLFLRASDAGARLRRALDAEDADREWRLESALYELLAQSGRRARLRGAGPAPAWLLRVRDRLNEGEIRPELARIAAAEGVDPCHLARAFHDHFGLSASEWHRRRRLARARRRIAGSDASLAAIAVETGFADQAHLSREFRRACGMPPGAWRRAVRWGPTQSPFKTRRSGRGILTG